MSYISLFEFLVKPEGASHPLRVPKNELCFQPPSFCRGGCSLPLLQPLGGIVAPAPEVLGLVGFAVVVVLLAERAGNGPGCGVVHHLKRVVVERGLEDFKFFFGEGKGCLGFHKALN